MVASRFTNFATVVYIFIRILDSLQAMYIFNNRTFSISLKRLLIFNFVKKKFETFKTKRKETERFVIATTKITNELHKIIRCA